MKVKIRDLYIDLQRLRKEVNILLVSDLHYDIEKEKSLKDPECKGKTINKSLVKSIQGAGKEWKPDIVIVAGDLVNQNKEKSYSLFFDLIERLVKDFPNLKEAVFTTPGNHDIKRENFIGILPYMNELTKYDPGDLMNSSTNNKWVDILLTVTKKRFSECPQMKKALEKYESEYFETYLKKTEELSAPTLIGNNKPILGPFEVNYPVKKFRTVYIKNVHGLTLVCHNSSFFCDISQATNDRNHLFLVRDLVEQAIDQVKRMVRHGPVISFLHHPFYYLHETEHVAPAPFGDYKKNEGKFNNFNKIVLHSDLVLSGHVHGDLHDPAYLQNRAYLITNGTSYTTEKLFKNKTYPYTFAIIKVNKLLNKFSLRKYIYQNKNSDGDGIGSPRQKGEYKCRNNGNDDCKFYPFLERSAKENTSLEMEKVRAIEYFSSLGRNKKAAHGRINAHQRHMRNQLFICQLYLDYPEEINAKRLENFVFSQHYDPHLGTDIVKIRKGLRGIPIQVVLIDDREYIPAIKRILKDRMERFESRPEQVYFSVNRELLKNKKDGLLKSNIDELKRSFQSMILSSKKYFISINLLYH